MEITRFGHSCVLVESDGARVLIDPGNFSAGSAFEVSGLDAIAVTHQHADHIDHARLPELFNRNPAARKLADPDTAAEFPEWESFGDGSATQFADIALSGVGTTHAEILPAIARVANTGLLVRVGDVTLFHPGDSYETVPEGVDVLALPLTAPWAKVAETVDFVRKISPSVVFPIHDAGVVSAMHATYLGHVTRHAGVGDVRALGATESMVVQ